MDPSKPVVIFDFDQTVIEQDSSQFLRDFYGFSCNHFASTYPEQENMYLDCLFKRCGVSHNDLADAMKGLVFNDQMKRLIMGLGDGFNLVILSSGFVFYIESFLRKENMEGYFQKIVAHPYKIRLDGSLVMTPLHHQVVRSQQLF